jgi:uncharacterized protein YihD (DUF1040 family)
MKNKNRIPQIIKELERIWKKYPDLRLGQLIQNCFDDIYYVEDKELIEGIERFYNDSQM